ncbi:hypothetical protein [Tychonema sp. BBK16]|uniref:hypothetical protein n=1 Tax=Tychonema sp. BBK16 TaxID=2699888 RepID=UPI001F356BE7|nr:hypothetical protein [Tychonema sp. BBK16]MCF6373724.1 hypothetical protein [Tychonema sp. BBK16]
MENELRLNASNEYRDRELEAVRDAIANLLDGFANLRVRRSPLRMTVEKQGDELKMGEQDPEFVRADWLIKRKEIINY